MPVPVLLEDHLVGIHAYYSCSVLMVHSYSKKLLHVV